MSDGHQGIPDQRDVWTATYDIQPEGDPKPSAFLDGCAPFIPHGSRVLELGCGAGVDAVALAALGHEVMATDFVAEIIARNREWHGANPRLHFRQMRIDEPFPLGDAAFDAVYAHLTLHYFTDEVTRAVFRELRRVLRPGGMLMFACKSDRDPLYGAGIEIEPDLFNLDGKIRHFFSEAYARACLVDGFALDRLESKSGHLYGKPSAWITVLAHTA